jgi:hypothetical protein
VMDTIVSDPFFEHMPRFFGMNFKELLASKHPTGRVCVWTVLPGRGCVQCQAHSPTVSPAPHSPVPLALPVTTRCHQQPGSSLKTTSSPRSSSLPSSSQTAALLMAQGSCSTW